MNLRIWLAFIDVHEPSWTAGRPSPRGLRSIVQELSPTRNGRMTQEIRPKKS
jgi:hypothetical protein